MDKRGDGSCVRYDEKKKENNEKKKGLCRSGNELERCRNYSSIIVREIYF